MMDWLALAGSPCGWLADTAPDAGVVLSSRVRLARNLAGERFPGQMQRPRRETLLRKLLDDSASLEPFRDGHQLALEAVEPVHRRLLGERQLASRDLIESPSGGGVVLSADSLLSCMVNEEDHLRFQALRPGLDVESAWRAADDLNRRMGSHLEYATSERLGFLTACPANTGTGLRASVLVHLPGILQDHGEKLQEMLHARRLSIRGFFGEANPGQAFVFQVSNLATLGVDEPAIVDTLSRAVRELVAWEEQAREALRRGARSLLEDKIWRSFGILRHARLLTAPEAFLHASMLRLGASVGTLQIPVQTLNEILIQCQPAHSLLLGKSDDPATIDAWRAETVRAKLRRFAA